MRRPGRTCACGAVLAALPRAALRIVLRVVLLLAPLLPVTGGAPGPASALAGGGGGGGASRARAVRIEGLEPGIIDTSLVCTLLTSGLPDLASRETLASGLPSALVIAFSLLDAAGNERAVSRVEVRIEPDLWEQTLVVRSPLAERRATSLEEVAQLMARLGPLPVLPLARLPVPPLLQIRARLAVQPLAPAELDRVGALFEGGRTSAAEPNRHESSVRLGSLVRYFLGKQPGEDWVAEAFTSRFDWQQLERRRSGAPAPSGDPRR